MKRVLDSWPVTCHYCEDRVMKKDVIMGSIMWVSYNYCSELCEWEHDYDMRRNMRRM